jgi:hypothetical protein
MLKGPIKIDPYVSVGPLFFGMTQSELLSLFQVARPPASSYDRDEHLTTLYWMENGLQTVFAGNTGPLVMVSLYANISQIFLRELELVWDQSSTFLTEVIDSSHAVYELSGITVFLDHGLSAHGLESTDNSTKSITAFRRGTWDETLSMMRRLK